jgi:hypothetical protein
MGSLEGALNASLSFWIRGYRGGFESNSDTIPTLEECHWRSHAHTVSPSRAGLYRNGYILGVKDRVDGKPKHTTTYEDYRASREKVKTDRIAQKVLNGVSPITVRGEVPDRGTINAVLGKLVAEHGCPARFSCAQVATLLRTRAVDVGRSATRDWAGEYGYAEGSWVGRYEDRFFVVEPKPDMEAA